MQSQRSQHGCAGTLTCACVAGVLVASCTAPVSADHEEPARNVRGDHDRVVAGCCIFDKLQKGVDHARKAGALDCTRY